MRLGGSISFEFLGGNQAEKVGKGCKFMGFLVFMVLKAV